MDSLRMSPGGGVLASFVCLRFGGMRADYVGTIKSLCYALWPFSAAAQ